MQEDVGFGADKRYDFVGFRLVRELDLLLKIQHLFDQSTHFPCPAARWWGRRSAPKHFVL